MAKAKTTPVQAQSEANGQDVAVQPVAETSAETAQRAGEIVDELGLSPIGVDDLNLETALKVYNQVALAKYKTRVTWYVFRAKAGENALRNGDGSPKLDAIAAGWPEFAKTLTVSAREGNALRFEAAERAVIEYFTEHNAHVAANEPGLIASANGQQVTVPTGYKGAEADRETYAEQFLAAGDRFATRIDRHVAAIKAEREVKRAAASAAKAQASNSVKVATL